ncbi:MAG: threonine--tRNA ligase [Candidatus Thermoplasmatota archaeon]|jgi:threonyl-tRNA synthetase|nr:threonine--tRNA ligase [Candidatus Thermoplasmatota archaeon]MCL5789782.1 threonine--tRNA ligase [Candidatus Thermoplasmatota archaeon]
MKVLQLDVENMSYELIEPETSVYDESEEKKFSVEDAVVMLISVEKGDNEEIASKAIQETLGFMKKQKRKLLLIYPFAHLSRELESPREARDLLEFMRKTASESCEVVKAPFGWNKKWSIKIKGHPLAEQLKNYSGKVGESIQGASSGGTPAKEEISDAIKQEEKVRSTWYILTPEGELVPRAEFRKEGYENLKKFADYEITKVRTYQQVPPHIKLMQKLQLVDYEPGSDQGNMRFYPNGRLIKSLLERYVTEKTVSYGAIEVETPIMYDYGHPALKEYLNRFPSRHYIVKSDDKEFFLRFSADFGQFLLMSDATVSYKQLPFRFYEITRYSFRRELSGELTGLKRLRAFTMPDMHTMCAGIDQAKEEFKKQFDFCMNVLDSIGIEQGSYEAAIRMTEEFWKENGDFIRYLVKTFGKPVLIEMWNFRYAYFDPKFEFNVVDTMGKATALSTVQMDHENGKRYNMTYIDANSNRQFPIILHDSPSGAIERVIYALLEQAAEDEKKGKTPSLPLWLSPTQVRFVPLADRHLKKCIEEAKYMTEKGIRADVDDTDSSLSKKIRNAEQNWVPYICVIGDREMESNKLSVRTRGKQGQSDRSSDELAQEILGAVAGMPKAPLSLSMMLSKRPIFRG